MSSGAPPSYGQPSYPPHHYPGVQMQAPPPQQPMAHTTVVVQQRPGGCTSCGGQTYETFSTAGIIWAICCFPLGLICLFNDKDIKCASCGRRQ